MSKNVNKFFKDYFAQFRPSRVHGEYRRTFAYRLSELVFGSLIASYILGFLSFSSSLVREKEIGNIASYFDPFSPLVLVDIPTIAKGYILFIYIIVSFIYALFTALIYFNFHQSILYIQRSDKNAANDYLISLLVAVTFGLSMLAPRYAGSLFFILAAIILRKKKVVSDIFFQSISSYILKLLKADENQAGWSDDEGNTERERITKKLKSEMELFGKTPESWLAEPTRHWATACYAFSLIWTAAMLAGLFEWGISPIPWGRMALFCAIHAVLLAIIAYVLMKSLTDATKKLAAGDNENYQDAVDRQFLEVLQASSELFKETQIPVAIKEALIVPDTSKNTSASAEASDFPNENASTSGNDVG